MKNNNATIANLSLSIIEQGFYEVNEKRIDVKESIKFSRENTITVSPDESDKLLNEIKNKISFKTEISVLNGSTLNAIENENDSKIAVLNFASAKNPGGGFIGGASAQEESLARSSSLYDSLIKDTTMYQFNKNRQTYLYSDYLIYSPKVVFWMNDFGKFYSEPKFIDVITCPAPNKRAMIQNKKEYEFDEIESVFRRRINKVLAIALKQEVEILILGAWGCGVFRNSPENVAKYFKEEIIKNFPNQFKKIVFAVYDKSKDRNCINAFENEFQD